MTIKNYTLLLLLVVLLVLKSINCGNFTSNNSTTNVTTTYIRTPVHASTHPVQSQTQSVPAGIYIPTKVNIGGISVNLLSVQVIVVVCVVIVLLIALIVALCCCCFYRNTYTLTPALIEQIKQIAVEETEMSRENSRSMFVSASSNPPTKMGQLQEPTDAMGRSYSFHKTSMLKSGPPSQRSLPPQDEASQQQLLKEQLIAAQQRTSRANSRANSVKKIPRKSVTQNASNYAIDDPYSNQQQYHEYDQSGYNSQYSDAQYYDNPYNKQSYPVPPVPPIPPIPPMPLIPPNAVTGLPQPIIVNEVGYGTVINDASYIPTDINYNPPTTRIQDTQSATYVGEAEYVIPSPNANLPNSPPPPPPPPPNKPRL